MPHGVLFVLVESLGPELKHKAVDYYAKRLHQITAQIKMIEHIVVKNSELSQISVGADLAVKGGEYETVTVVQRRVHCIVRASGEIHAEKRVEIDLCRMTLAVACVEQFDIAYIRRDKIRLFVLAELIEELRLFSYLLRDYLAPYHGLYLVAPCYLRANLRRAVMAAVMRDKLRRRTSLRVAEYDLHFLFDIPHNTPCPCSRGR